MTQKHARSHHFGVYRRWPCSVHITLFISILAATFGSPCFGFAQGTPKISISPTSLNYGNVRVEGTTELSTTITNTGTVDLTISGVEITGVNPSEFSQTHDCTTIPAGGSCTLTATFSPALPYATKSAVVSVHSNDPKKPVASVKLKGKAPLPKISISPSSVKLGPTRVGSTSLPVVVTISNKGTSDLVVSDITIDGVNGSEFGRTHNCTTIPAGGSCTMEATFSPALPLGKKSAAAAISSNDPKKPAVYVKLSGAVDSVAVWDSTTWDNFKWDE